MSKRQIIMLLGALIVVFPFLGFSSLWDMIILIVIGVSIIVLAYKMRPLVVDDFAEQIHPENKLETKIKEPDFPFVDHRNLSETDTTNK